LLYRPDIDGLRGTVALFHFGEDAIPGGFVGVDVFIVISGFLITGLLAEAHREGRLPLTWFFGNAAEYTPLLHLWSLSVEDPAGQPSPSNWGGERGRHRGRQSGTVDGRQR
jgi:peptidoglycan/LPS O-acetylase OafA/YrhL